MGCFNSTVQEDNKVPSSNAIRKLMGSTADAANDANHQPDPVDLHVGGRIRMRRKILGVSQEHLADDLGLTFQQVQKYEKGANRVSASKMYQIARSLQAPISYFFDGLPDPVQGDSELAPAGDDRAVHDFLMTSEGLELATIFPKIRRGRVRRRVLDLVRAMSDEDAALDGQ